MKTTDRLERPHAAPGCTQPPPPRTDSFRLAVALYLRPTVPTLCKGGKSHIPLNYRTHNEEMRNERTNNNKVPQFQAGENFRFE